jgi:hypothetical protein
MKPRASPVLGKSSATELHPLSPAICDGNVIAPILLKGKFRLRFLNDVKGDFDATQLDSNTKVFPLYPDVTP